MNNVRFAVIAAALLAIPVHGVTQESPADPSIGKWAGDWTSRGRPAGSMEMVVDVKADQVAGQVRSTGSPGCSVDWEKLMGVRKGEKIVAQYNLGGRCGRVDVIYAIDPDGEVMTGTWTSEYPGSGTFRLTK